eukprot:UN05768
MSRLGPDICPVAAQKGDYKAYHFTKSIVIYFLVSYSFPYTSWYCKLFI